MVEECMDVFSFIDDEENDDFDYENLLLEF